ncbi:hypothetical protein HJC99_02680 [Candidatus Saccharibacteria bacterium]|nr:hypothetical protein [Candidatus Saccharibacteria bacterium]
MGARDGGKWVAGTVENADGQYDAAAITGADGDVECAGASAFGQDHDGLTVGTKREDRGGSFGHEDAEGTARHPSGSHRYRQLEDGAVGDLPGLSHWCRTDSQT